MGQIMIPNCLRSPRTVPTVIPQELDPLLEIEDESSETIVYPDYLSDIIITKPQIEISSDRDDIIMIPTFTRQEVTDVTVSDDEDSSIDISSHTPYLYPDLAPVVDNKINPIKLESDSIMIPPLIREERTIPEIIEVIPNVNEITVKKAPIGDSPEIHSVGNDDDIDIEFIPKGNGVLSVVGTEDYENRIDSDDDIPNKKWIDDQEFLKTSDCCEPPSSLTVNRTDDEISSFTFASGKVITLNRSGGRIQSIVDGTYLRTLVRENDRISEVVVTEI